MASLRGYIKDELPSRSEFQEKAAAWHEKRAAAYGRMSRNDAWSPEKREELRICEEAERRNAADYRAGRIEKSLLEFLREED